MQPFWNALTAAANFTRVAVLGRTVYAAAGAAFPVVCSADTPASAPGTIQVRLTTSGALNSYFRARTCCMRL